MTRNKLEEPRDFVSSAAVSKVRRDALPLPVTVARRLRPLGPLIFLGRGFGVCRSGLSPRFGLGECALRCRAEWFAFRLRGGWKTWGIVAHAGSTGLQAALIKRSCGANEKARGD